MREHDAPQARKQYPKMWSRRLRNRSHCFVGPRGMATFGPGCSCEQSPDRVTASIHAESGAAVSAASRSRGTITSG
jgi:hypothetical protein